MRIWKFGGGACVMPRRAALIAAAINVILIAVLANCGGGSSGPTSQPNPPFFITPSTPTVLQTQTLQLHAMLQMSDGSLQDVTSSALWSSSTDNFASIEGIGQEFPGLATGNAAGSATMTATYQGMSATANLLCVSNTSPQALSVLPNTVTVAVGTVQQFRAAEVTDEQNAIEETGTSVWTVSDTSKATIQSAGESMPGVLTATSPGTITVTATSPDGLRNMATVVIPATVPNTYKTPLPEMTASQTYLGYQGGLYENGSNTPPADHNAAGLAAAAAVQPLDTGGNPNPAGSIVLLGVGMSNAHYEFSVFAAEADVMGSGANYPTVMTLDGAHVNAVTCWWTYAEGIPNCGSANLGNQYDRVRDDVLAPVGLTEAQVQVLWVKEADEFPARDLGNPSLCDPSITGCANNVPVTTTGSGCATSSTAEACYYDGLLGQMIRAARTRYPDLKQIFISSRIYGGYASFPLNPEPYAYEYGLATKWLIENQVIQARTGQVDPVSGSLSYNDGSAAWMAWGPYIWANNVQPQTFDGLAWEIYPTDDFEPDGTHPSDPSGRQKVASQLMNFFLTSPYTLWYPSGNLSRRPQNVR